MNQYKNNKNKYSVKIINSLDEISSYYGMKKSKLITYIDKNKIYNNRYIDLDTSEKLLLSLNLEYVIDKQLTVISEIQKSWKDNLNKNKIITIGILGHINHGKTTLIKNIIKQDIIEDGDITQNINIYNKNNIYFLDTPGHSLFHFMREHILNIIDLIFLVISLEDGIAFETNRIINLIIENNLSSITRVIFTKSDIAKYNYKDLLLGLNKAGLYDFQYCIIDYNIDIMKQINSILNLSNFDLIDKLLYNQLLTIKSTDKIYNLIKLNYGEITKKSSLITECKIYRVTGTFNLDFKPISKIQAQCFAYCTTDQNLDINDINFVHTNDVELIELHSKYIIGKLYLKNHSNNSKEDGIYYKKKIVCIIGDIIMKSIIINMAKQHNVDKIIVVVLKSEKHIISTIDNSQHTILFRVSDNNSIIKTLSENKVKYTIIDNIYQLEKYLSQNNLDIFNNINIKNIAEVIKIFEINNKKIIGCQVLKGDFKMNQKIFIAKSSNINEIDDSSTIVSMKQDDKFIKQTKKNILFGVILSDPIKIEIGYFIYS